MPFSDNHVHNILEHPRPKKINSIMSKRQPPSPQSQCWVMGRAMDHPKPTLTVGGGDFFLVQGCSKYYEHDCLREHFYKNLNEWPDHNIMTCFMCGGKLQEFWAQLGPHTWLAGLKNANFETEIHQYSFKIELRYLSGSIMRFFF